MAHIVEFAIEGLAGRKEVYRQRLSRDINIFFGLNGSGKTSLLRILDSAMAGDASSIRMVPFKTAEVTIYSIDWGREFVRKIRRPDKVVKSSTVRRKAIRRSTGGTAGAERLYYSEHVSEPEGFEWELDPEIQDPTYPASWRHVYLPTWRLYGGTASGSLPTSISRPTEVEREHDWDHYFAQKLESLWKTYSNSLLSNVRMIQEEGIASMLRTIVSQTATTGKEKVADPKMVYKRVGEFLRRQKSKTAPLGTLRQFENKYAKDSLFARTTNDIARIEQQIEATTASRYQLEALIARMFSGGKTMEFSDTGVSVKADTGEDIGLASLASGEKQVLGILIETLLAETNSLLIDEPEISLHVDWQLDLIFSMHQLNPSAQLILATHSPEIMANVSDNKIFKL